MAAWGVEGIVLLGSWALGQAQGRRWLYSLKADDGMGWRHKHIRVARVTAWMEQSICVFFHMSYESRDSHRIHDD